MSQCNPGSTKHRDAMHSYGLFISPALTTTPVLQPMQPGAACCVLPMKGAANATKEASPTPTSMRHAISTQ